MSFFHYLSLIDMLARMELRSDASRFFFGYLWWILEPMLYVAVFYFVFAMILTSRQPDFLFFLMTGKLAFNWFSKSVQQAASSINRGAGLVGRVDVPKTLFPMASIQAGLYRQAAVFVLLALVLSIGGYPPTLTWFYIIPVLLVNYLLIVACSFICACLVSMVRDFLPLISLAMIFLMFTSGIFWDPRALEDPAKVDMLMTYNPIAFILDAYRQVLMYNTAPDILHLISLGAVCGAAICAMVLVIRRANHYLALKALTA
jgi:homopolymeric O-antigen transport system permease protein